MNLADKPYQLTFEQRPQYLYAHIHTDAITMQSEIEYLEDLVQHCHAVQCRRILLKRDIPTMLSTTDLYFATAHFASIISGLRVAVVNPHAVNDKGSMFAEVVGRNRGALIKMFKDEAEAEQWLLEKA
jgi:hypothetical protein